MTASILVMAGGTGGHVFPALAVANRLIELGHRVTWLGTERGLESRVVPEAGIEIDWLTVSGLRGKGVKSLILAPFMLLKACFQARAVLRRRKPDVVLGMGGFVAGPGGLMAFLNRTPLVIHEQNRVPGTTNRMLSKLATQVLEAFPGSFEEATAALAVGNPLRKEILFKSPEKAETDGKLNLLVVGGSLGAAILNEMVPAALALIPDISAKLRVTHQCGKTTASLAEESYSELGVDVEIVPFIEDMASAYQEADLLICRAGAMTVSEVAVKGLPAIFVPLPHAIDDHQTANARFLADHDAAKLLPQRELTPESLSAFIADLVGDGERRLAMGERARNLSEPNATEQVVNICLREAA